MASGDERGATPETITGVGLRVGLVSARWNVEIVSRLITGAKGSLDALGIRQLTEVEVPGCYEIPLACSAMARSGRVDTIVCVGAVIRGETTHYELVAGECGAGVQRVQLDTGVPIGFGVLTVENLDQAMKRSQIPEGHNVGAEAAEAAIEMARVVQAWRPA